MLHHTTTMRYKMKDGTAQDQQDQWAQFQHLSPSGWKVDAKWDLETELRETHSDTYPEIPNDLPVDEQKIIRIPNYFYYDHQSRDLPTPEAIRYTKRHVWISLDNPALPELESDADYYWEERAAFESCGGLCRSALATLKAIAKGLVLEEWRQRYD
tara:strand:+ start:170 stop:637 length:468 start_codon:yes stop_codon:yes gene_type:complete